MMKNLLGWCWAIMLSVGMMAHAELVGYWPFDEGQGTTVRDASGNGNDGTFVGNPRWVQGMFGTALEFDGKQNYVAIPDADILDLTDAATMMAWFSPIGPLTGTRMMVKNDSIFVIFDFGNPDSLDFLVKPNNDFVESATTEWKVGEWYHFAGTFDGDTLRVYINGQLEGEKSGVPPIRPSDLELWIGADDWPGKPHSPTIIDEVRLYDEALDEATIQRVMKESAAVAPQDKLPVVWAWIKEGE